MTHDADLSFSVSLKYSPKPYFMIYAIFAEADAKACAMDEYGNMTLNRADRWVALE